MSGQRATRRSTAEVRELILTAAAGEFAAQGFESTTMRTVADAAQISPSVLHRHFPSKDRLFAATTLTPFFASVEEFATSWQTQRDLPRSEQEVMAELIGDLYRHLSEHRLTLVRLISMHGTGDGELVDALRDGLAQVIRALQPIGEQESALRGWFSPDAVERAVSMTMMLVTGLVLMRPWVETDADEEQLVQAVTSYALHGIRQAP
jgi:AcrR family transcriptional regulator